jgi:cytidylate kinase
MYRAITLFFLRNRINFENAEDVANALNDIEISFRYNEEAQASDIMLNDEDVSIPIRDMLVNENVSQVAAIKQVRAFAVAQQQAIGKGKGIVMDGRDIGSVVFPEAELKIFMTADPSVRVMRRFKEMYVTNPHITIDEVRHNLELRDYIDSTREESPLHKAKDAIVLDNSSMTREEQLDKVMHWIAERTEKAPATA